MFEVSPPVLRNGQRLRRELQDEGLLGVLLDIQLVANGLNIQVLVFFHGVDHRHVASSTGLKVLSFFSEWLDRLEVGVMPKGPASSSSYCEGCEDRGGCYAVGSGSSSEVAGSSPLLAGELKNKSDAALAESQ